MSNGSNSDIPIGDVKFLDHYVPALPAGNWRITVEHSVSVASDSMKTEQAFVVSAPQFGLDPTEIANRYPPPGSTGRYAEVLPHVVFAEPVLPWERSVDESRRQNVKDGDLPVPWLALLVLDEDDFVGGDDSSVRLTPTTVADFLKPDGAVLKPSITKEADVPDDKLCAYVRLPVDRFRAIVPHSDELSYLAHCRQINTGDKAVLGLHEHGLYSVVVANRFPAAPPAESGGQVKNIVHLVSLEGLKTYLADGADFGIYESVALLSLASWTFWCQADRKEDFRGLMEALIAAETVEPGEQREFHPDRLWLRLPPVDSSSNPEVERRLRDGFVPLDHHTRTGEDTFAWYRGPLTPLVTSPLEKAGPFLTADAALIYDPANGLFDLSLAAAWEIGRTTALADKSFAARLLDFRRRGLRRTDALLYRMQSDLFGATEIDRIEHDSRIQSELLRALDEDLLGSIDTVKLDSVEPRSIVRHDADPKQAVADFLAAEDVQGKLRELATPDLDPIAEWLARLLLLHPIPFDYLVPDGRMLPVESLRFFFLDRNWIGALLDGALSIGLESSRHTLFHGITREFLHASAHEAAKVHRERLRGIPPTASADDEEIICGFLLRSTVVSGWPNLAVRPRLKNGGMAKILRMDRLSPNVLLCLFAGVPDSFDLSEPQEGFRFGVDDSGWIPLRSLSACSLGKQLKSDGVQSEECRRLLSDRVLDLSPGSADGLIRKLKLAVETEMGTCLSRFGPADFALQMVKAPEAVTFCCCSGGPVGGGRGG